MSLIESCIKNDFHEIINIIENGANYLDIDENGNTPFHYLKVMPPTPPKLAGCDPTLFKIFKTRRDIETDAIFNYQNGFTHIHSSIIIPHCPSLKIDVSESSAQIFIEWCYCKSSPTLEKMAPFCSVKKSMELLCCHEASSCWKYLEDFSISLSYLLPDVSIEYLRYFENNDLINDHPILFEKITQIFFATFNSQGGDDFIVDLSQPLLLRCLHSLSQPH
ncbi:hypothetical protein EDI_254060 [Entamoeba dispar SAW760]|uniref:Uncharacterized protein n=1 Tax=Entamoeba dispar (strain ATCC PRA-260 / SAW760) TaxID=370354 RepID=B0E7N5_ENTDS|nr:uncharacterized protein EDI_254060 [Entamoeba dispar SAW760]EDR29464.1 hypothetical protein EDI_254060 [Entamoeba dispar SAW760]|eukprot:EDR29464.1 hypothetical protein EDI_254060 [Entamoeba dispar SAW760]